MRDNFRLIFVHAAYYEISNIKAIARRGHRAINSDAALRFSAQGDIAKCKSLLWRGHVVAATASPIIAAFSA